ALPGAGGVEPCVTPLAAEVRSLIESAVKTIDHEPLARPDAAGKPNDETNGAFVLDVALVEPNEWWVGCHQQRTRVDRWPGGVPAIELPDHAVSRAYLKMAEALRWSAVPAAKGELWVELGCAPGGASQALLDAGMLVLGVDPAEVARAVAADERFAHLRGRASDIKRRELTDARWLAADINAAPDYTLDAVESLVTHADAHFRGLLLTLKLPDWATGSPENLDRYAERVRGWGFRDVRMRQLAFNRREFCLAAMRSRGQRRLRR
ncbi:MAG: SAM-dependent methyltransferase, partial [Planctomycetota bacterium]